MPGHVTPAHQLRAGLGGLLGPHRSRGQGKLCWPGSCPILPLLIHTSQFLSPWHPVWQEAHSQFTAIALVTRAVTSSTHCIYTMPFYSWSVIADPRAASEARRSSDTGAVHGVISVPGLNQHYQLARYDFHVDKLCPTFVFQPIAWGSEAVEDCGTVQSIAPTSATPVVIPVPQADGIYTRSSCTEQFPGGIAMFSHCTSPGSSTPVPCLLLAKLECASGAESCAAACELAADVQLYQPSTHGAAAAQPWPAPRLGARLVWARLPVSSVASATSTPRGKGSKSKLGKGKGAAAASAASAAPSPLPAELAGQGVLLLLGGQLHCGLPAPLSEVWAFSLADCRWYLATASCDTEDVLAAAGIAASVWQHPAAGTWQRPAAPAVPATFAATASWQAEGRMGRAAWDVQLHGPLPRRAFSACAVPSAGEGSQANAVVWMTGGAMCTNNKGVVPVPVEGEPAPDPASLLRQPWFLCCSVSSAGCALAWNAAPCGDASAAPKLSASAVFTQVPAEMAVARGSAGQDDDSKDDDASKHGDEWGAPAWLQGVLQAGGTGLDGVASSWACDFQALPSGDWYTLDIAGCQSTGCSPPSAAGTHPQLVQIGPVDAERDATGLILHQAATCGLDDRDMFALRCTKTEIMEPAPAPAPVPVFELDELPIKGHGLVHFADGSQYEGEFRHRACWGQGSARFANGDTYTGQWVDGLPHGQGTGNWADGHVYVGQWREGLRHGTGEMHMVLAMEDTGEDWLCPCLGWAGDELAMLGGDPHDHSWHADACGAAAKTPDSSPRIPARKLPTSRALEQNAGGAVLPREIDSFEGPESVLLPAAAAAGFARSTAGEHPAWCSNPTHIVEQRVQQAAKLAKVAASRSAARDAAWLGDFAASGSLAGPASPAPSPHSLFTPDPFVPQVAQYTGEWLGDARNGHGEAVFVTGDRYVGQWRWGLRDGAGSITYSDGGTHSGQWRNGVRCGEGREQTAAADVYEGLFLRDLRHGFGQLFAASGAVTTGDFKYGRLAGIAEQELPDGTVTEGKFASLGCMSGIGTRTKRGEGTMLSVFELGEVTTKRAADLLASRGSVRG